MGSADRLHRLLMGTLLLTFTVTGLERFVPWMQWMIVAIQAELILTGLFGWCPFYAALGMNSCPVRDDEESDPPAETREDTAESSAEQSQVGEAAGD